MMLRLLLMTGQHQHKQNQHLFVVTTGSGLKSAQRKNLHGANKLKGYICKPFCIHDMGLT